MCINSLLSFPVSFEKVAPNGKELKNVKSKVVSQDLLSTKKIKLHGKGLKMIAFLRYNPYN